jgi:hypothetical protein
VAQSFFADSSLFKLKIEQSDHSSQHKPLECWNYEFKSHSEHGLMFSLLRL